MNLAMVRLYCGESGQPGFYNMQELGLAKALEKHGFSVYIMVLSDEIHEIKEKCVSSDITIVYVPAIKIANHGVFNCKNLINYHIDVVHLQSDNQLYAPHVMNFCKNKGIKCYNYVGTLYSDSSNTLKRKVMDIISNRNIRYFRKYTTFAKTPTVQNQLKVKGVKAEVLPVGLDVDIIPNIKESKEELRTRMGFPIDKKILIFVGRLEEYKKPLDAIELIKSLNDEYSLIIIGQGSLEKAVLLKINEYGIKNRVNCIKILPNKEIHEYYKISDFFVNFNDTEIFGMSILEAMYQGCVVVAREAPGPDYIIENGVSGYLVKTLNEMKEKIIYAELLEDEGKNRILSAFEWNITARKIITMLK